jgi:protein-S-isoprenylcysteine O-methyltransferase Ste14
MKATHWEFKNRAMVFGWMFGFTFALYALDHQNSAASLANWLEPRMGIDAQAIARFLFAGGALLLTLAALIRTWASAYLKADVVYASEVKTQSVVADGPYRFVRNPLYFGNVVMALGMGVMMSRAGFFVLLVAMVVFCYRLILLEESDLRASQGESYLRYCKTVPRLWPSLWPRIPTAEGRARWKDGFMAELWAWGYAAAVAAYAITMKLVFFFVILAVSLLLFFGITAVLQKKAGPQNSNAKGS